MKVLALLLLCAAVAFATNVTAVVEFANEQWNCALPTCTSRVKAGDWQNDYQCAEFVARSLAAGGFVDLSPLAARTAYGSHKYNGKIYDLLWTSSYWDGRLGLEDYLKARGWKIVGTSDNLIDAASALLVVGATGPYGHAVLGVGPNLLDAHNTAEYHVPGSFYKINAILHAPNSTKA